MTNDYPLTYRDRALLQQYIAELETCCGQGRYSFMFYYARRIQEVLKPYADAYRTP